MKSLRWLLLFGLLSVGSCPEAAVFSADPPPKVAIAKTAKQAIPQALLDAIALLERDREAIVTAQATVDAAMKAKAKAVLDAENDYKALVALLESLYGPTPPVPPVPPVPPTPPVPPVPPVPPTPVVQKVQMIVIEETGDSTPAFSRVRNSAEIRRWATDGGHALFFLDIDSAAKAGGTWKTWADRARNTKLPYLGIAPHEGGDPIKEGECPQDVAAFLKEVQRYGGVGKPDDCPTSQCPLKQGAK